MTPPERPEVAAQFAKAFTHIRGAHNGDDRYVGPPCGWCVLAGEQAAAAAEEIGLLGAAAAESLRGALDILDVIDGIVDDTHPEGDGCPLCTALDDLRAALEATAPSTPEPALDVERLARAMHASHVDCIGSGHASTASFDVAFVRRFHMDRAKALVAALTSEPRAAAPQEATDG